ALPISLFAADQLGQLRVAGALGNLRVPQLDDNIDIWEVTLHQPPRLGHMAGEPLDRWDLVHPHNLPCKNQSINPKDETGAIRRTTLPITSSSSTKPTSEKRLSVEWLRLSPMTKMCPSGTVTG